MKRKYAVIVSCVLIVSCIAIASAAYNNSNNNNVQHLSFDFINQKSNLNDVVSSSELIVRGKVIKITPLEIKEVIFTDYEIDVDDVFKGEKQSVVVRLSGGTLNGTEQMHDEIKPLEKNQDYIFCLEKVFPKDPNSDVFSPIGAYQGIFAIKESNLNNIVKIENFNPSNVVEKTISGKELDITQYFQ